MPVTFGAVQTLTGAGTWTYPDVGLVIGLLLQVTDPGTAPRQWGTEIVRYRDVGVFAPITEAGKMLGRGFYNDVEVTYDIGNAPIGLAYELAAGVTATATEILSETPPSGGGGGVDPGVGDVYLFGPQAIGASGGSNTVSWDLHQGWSWSSSGLTLPLDGIYHVTFTGQLVPTGALPTSVRIIPTTAGGFDTPEWTEAWPGTATTFRISSAGLALKGHGIWSAGDVMSILIGCDSADTVNLSDADLTVAYVSSGTGS